MLYSPKRTQTKILLATFLAAVSVAAIADVCVNDDGFVVPCPPDQLQPVQGYWSLPVFVKGKPADIYIVGGAAIEGFSEIWIQVENGPVVLAACDTGYTGGTTPYRHCVLTIPVAGSYTLSGYKIQGNFVPPQTVAITVASH